MDCKPWVSALPAFMYRITLELPVLEPQGFRLILHLVTAFLVLFTALPYVPCAALLANTVFAE